jgi:hypothetical protein
VLFFKDIVEEKFNETGFQRLYEKECHICSVTMQVVSTLENDSNIKEKVLRLFDISEDAYENLKKGDHCNPKMVRQICDYLNISDHTLVKACFRSTTKSNKYLSEK